MSISSYSILTTVTAPASYLLTDLATWKSDWGVTITTDDDFINRTIDRCSAAAASACNRVFGSGAYQAIFRTEVGYRIGRLLAGDMNPILLPMWPVSSISSVVEVCGDTTNTLVEGIDFECDYPTGRLYRLDAYGNPRDWPKAQITAQWQAGYALPGQSAVSGVILLPTDIIDAVGRMVWNRYIERKRDPMVAEKTIFGVSNTKYLQGSQHVGNLSPDIADILDNYRQPVTA